MLKSSSLTMEALPIKVMKGCQRVRRGSVKFQNSFLGLSTSLLRWVLVFGDRTARGAVERMEAKILYPKGGYGIQSYGREKTAVDVIRVSPSSSFSRSKAMSLVNERNQRYRHMAMKTQQLSSPYVGELPLYTAVWVDDLLPDPRSFSKDEDEHEEKEEKMSRADRKDSLSDEDEEKKSYSKSFSKSSKGDK